jgi:hypothetical protein
VAELAFVTIKGVSIVPDQIDAIEPRRDNGEDRTFVHLRSGSVLDIAILADEFRDLLQLKVSKLGQSNNELSLPPMDMARAEQATQAMLDNIVGDIPSEYMAPKPTHTHDHGSHA